MRRLMLFGIGFTIACVIGVYMIHGNGLLLVAACCLTATIPLFLLKFRSAKIAAMILSGCMVGLLWTWGYDALYLSSARNYDGKVIQTQVEATDYCSETDYGVAAEGKFVLDGKTYRVRFYVNEHIQLKPGDRVTGSFRLRYTADGGEKEPTYHQGKGVFLLAYGRSDLQFTFAETVPTKYFAATARQKILSHLDSLFPEDTLGFARALLLGDCSMLSYEVDTAFRTSGIRHVVAVSGLHVSILFSVIYLFGGRHKIVGVALGLPVLVLFAAVAGFSPSIIRACVMQALMCLSYLFGKEYDPPTALSFSALVMLAANPLTITSVSFQLSVGCMVGIFLFSKRIHDYLISRKFIGGAKGRSLKARLSRWIIGSFSVTISAMITTTPLCAYYFDSVSLVSVLTNLLTLWIVSFIFYGIMAACIVGVFWLPLGQAVAWLVSWAIRYVILVADVLSRFPLAALYTKNVYVVVWLIFCYVLLGVLLINKQKHPVVFLCSMLAVLGVALTAARVEPYFDSFRFSALNVGQGQCLLLQSKGKTYLIDCGGDTPEIAADEAAATLLSQGITHLDGMILTHYDADHAGGAEYLLSRVPADMIYLPVTLDEAGMQRFADKYADTIQWIEQDTQITDGNISISLYPATDATTDNESSMCVLCQVDNCDILITGDRDAVGERKLLETHTLPDLDVLVVGHHGSKTATSLELLHATTPDIAVISVSATNNYGHPAQEVLDRLSLYGCTILRTDQYGTVIIKGR